MSSIPQDSAIEQISRSETDHSRSFWKALYRNAFSSIAGTVLSLVIGLFAFPFTVHRLGATSYGVWMLALSIVGYLGLLDIGLGPTLIKKTAEHVAHGRSETAALCRTVSTVCFIYTAMGILAGAAILVIGVAGEQWFKVGADLVPTFRIVVWLVGLQTAVGFPLSVGAGIVAGLQEFHILNGVNITANLLRTTLTIGLLFAGYGLISLVVSAFVISVANWLFTWAWAKKRIPELRLDIRSVNRSSVSEVASFSWAMLLWSVAGYALHQADRVIIGIYLPVASITTYEVGSRVNQYSRNLLQSWLDNIMPAAASLHTQHDHENIRALYFKSTRYLLLGYVSLASALACFGHTFLTLWVGPQFGESAAIMMFLVGASLFQAQTVVGHVILAATGRLRIFCTLMGLYSVVSVLMGVIFVIQWGLVGAAAAIAATVVLLESIFVLRIFKSFGITTTAVLRECHLPCLKFVIGPIVLGIILRQEIDIRSWPILLGALSLYGWALSCSLWIFGLTADERRDITTYAAGLLKPKPQSVGQ